MFAFFYSDPLIPNWLTMFEFIRTHRRLMQFLLMLVIVPSFALVGISGYQSFGDGANTIAKVGDQVITQQQYEEAQRQQIDRYRQMMGEQFDQKMFDTPEARQSILDNLIAERAVSAEVGRSHLVISDAVLQKEVLAIPGLTLPDGKFDLERYKAMLAAQGMTPQMYDARRRSDLALQQLAGAVQGTAFAPGTVTKRLSDITSEEREVQELLLPISQYVAEVKVTDAMVKDFYEKNAKFFMIPEQAKVEYVVLDDSAAGEQVDVSDADVTAYYAKNQKAYTTEEARQASHILVAVKKDASAADKAAAKAKAEAILAEVRKAPASFAAVAKAKSEDPASAEQGGDLGVIGKDGLPTPLLNAVAKLKQGEISDVVASDFGYHILTVTSLKPQHKYSEMAETFTNTVYEQSDSLKPVADKLKLKVETVANLSRTPSPALGTAPFNNAKFLAAIFSNDSLKDKRNTEAVTVAPNVLIAGRVVEFKPASKRPLADVEAMIRQRVTMEEAEKLAKKAGEAKLAALKASGDATGFGAAQWVSRSKLDGINRAAIAQVMKADTSKLPAYVGVELPALGYGIYRIGKVQQPAQVDEARRQQEKDQIGSILAQQEMFDYVEYLKSKAKVKIVKPVTAPAAATPEAP
eukprot:gene18754-22430_t